MRLRLPAVLVLIIALILTGCAAQNGDNQQNQDNQQDIAAVEAELKKLLPEPLEQDLYYYGLAEYAHVAAIKNVSEEEGNITVYEVEGRFEDGSGLGGTFVVQYILNAEQGTITEKVISNSRTEKPQINSILNSPVLIKAPLVAGTEWSQEMQIDDGTYTMTGQIIQVTVKQEQDRQYKEYKVRYTVSGLENYPNNTYIEERTFAEGKGMTSFAGLRSLDKLIHPDQKGLSEEEWLRMNMFGYGLSPR